MHTNNRRPLWLQGATVAVSLCASAARAEVPAPAEAEPASVEGKVILEEIVISTDRKDSFGANYVQAGTFRNAEVMDTPLTVNILPRTLLDAQQASSIGDALKDSAGVTFSQTNPAITSNISIRGIPVDNRANYRMNGGLPIVNLVDLPLEDKDRVEVLKGVSSLYYGFTTPSGIVNVVMKRPTAEPITALTATANEYGAYTGAIDVSRRFGDDKFGIRINAAGGELNTGVDRVLGHRALGAVALDWNPISSVTVRLDGEYIRKIQSETPLVQVNLVKGVTPAGSVLPPIPDPKTNLGSEWMTSDAHEQNTMGHVEWHMTDNWAITAEAGRSHLERDRNLGIFTGYNLATGAGTLGVRLAPGTTYDNQNYRLELAGGFSTGPIDHQVSVGSSYNRRTTNTGKTTIDNFAQNYYSPTAIAAVAEPPTVWTTVAPIYDKGTYIFDKASYSEWVDVLLGLRHTKYESNTLTVATGAETIYAAQDTSKSGGIVFKPFHYLSLYATYLEGLEEGGLAPLTATNAGQILPPGISKQKEFGVKAKPLDPLLLTLAYFDINRPSSYQNAANLFVQDGRTSYKGVEASANGEIGRQVSVLLNTMWEDAKLEQTSNPALIGARPENTPKFSSSGFVEYRPDFAGLGGHLGLTAGLVYIGNRAIDNVSGPNTLYIGGYTAYDAGARYSWRAWGSPMTLRFKVENLTNKRYWAGTGTDYLSEGLPRTAKIEFDAKL